MVSLLHREGIEELPHGPKPLSWVRRQPAQERAMDILGDFGLAWRQQRWTVYVLCSLNECPTGERQVAVQCLEERRTEAPLVTATINIAAAVLLR
jgi:hypothetical protein